MRSSMRTSPAYPIFVLILACLTAWFPPAQEPTHLLAKHTAAAERTSAMPHWHQGIVQWFDGSNGYGFLLTEQNESVLIHSSNILSRDPEQEKILVSGQAVAYRYTHETRQQPSQLIVFLQ